ncbi:MAG: hypothetical protein ACXVR9_15900 [Gaiellaceae bacterium]
MAPATQPLARDAGPTQHDRIAIVLLYDTLERGLVVTGQDYEVRRVGTCRLVVART